MAPLLDEEYRKLGFVLTQNELLNKYRKFNTSSWTCFGRISGYPEELNFKKKLLKKGFHKSAKIQFYTEKSIQRVLKFARLFKLRDLYCHVKSSEPLRNLSAGIPSNAALKMIQWRTNRDIPYSTEVDHSPRGFLLVVPLCPFEGRSIRELVETTRSVTSLFKVDLGITLNTLSESVIEAVISLQFNNANDGHQSLKALYTQFNLLGYWPYRLDIETMNWIIDGTKSFWKAGLQIKDLFDPNHIIAPGRYIPASDPSTLYFEKQNGWPSESSYEQELR